MNNKKSILARLLSTENINVIHNNVSTASFDLQSRTLTLPIFKEELSNDLYDLFIGHEVSHALNTPQEGWHDSIIDLGIPRRILNIVEDVRIEKKIKVKYPGLKSSFFKGYQYLYNEGFFGPVHEIPSYSFLDRVNVYFKVAAYADQIPFTEKEKVLVDMIGKVATFDDVVKIGEILKKLYEKHNTPKIEIGGLLDGNDSSFSETPDSGDVDFQDIPGEDGENVQSDEQSEEQRMGSRTQDLIEQLEKDGLDIGKETKTDKNLEKNYKSFFDSTNVTFANTTHFNLNKVIVDYSVLINQFERGVDYRKHLKNFTKNNKKNVMYLLKEFELRKNAKQMQKVQIHNTGSLDEKRLYSYKITDDIFRKNAITDKGKSHGLVMFLDWSASMKAYMEATMDQVVELAFFCRMLNIPFEVYSFTTSSNYFNNVNKSIFNVENNAILCNDFHLNNIFSSRMSVHEFNKAVGNMLAIASKSYHITSGAFRMAGTPLHETIMSAIDIVNDFKKKTGVDEVNTIFLTDGDGVNLDSKMIIDNREGGFRYGDVKYRNEVCSNGSKNYIHYYRDKNIYTWFHKSSEKTNIDVKKYVSQKQAHFELLRKATGSKVIGFYLTDESTAFKVIAEVDLSLGRNTLNMRKIHEDFIQKKFHMFGPALGYDEYFLLHTKPNDDFDKFMDSSYRENNQEKLLDDFEKGMAGKLKNRVILNRFIELIV